MLTPLVFKPGIYKEGTDYSAEGGWIDCDKMRFRKGMPEKIGGWQKLSTTALTGICRAIHTWSDLDGFIRSGLGTHLKYQLEEGGLFYDITPLRKTTNPLANNPIATTNLSSIVTITDVGHGAAVGDYVTISGATAFGGIAAGALNQEFVILTVPTADTYTVETGDAANSTTTGGGAAVVAAYQLPIGLADFVAGLGWGAGTWGGSVGWGSAATVSIGGTQLRVWSHDNYGEDLLINPAGYGIYYWDASAGTSTRAVELSTIGDSGDTPTAANLIMTTDTRQVIAFGVTDIVTGILDPMLVRWSDEERPAYWTPAADNSAGGQRLAMGSRIIAAQKARGEKLVWTDAALYAMRPDSEFVYGFGEPIAQVSIVGPNASVMTDSIVYWMDQGQFYRYTGRVETIDCTLLDYVFSDINLTQAFKITCGHNAAFGEVWWWYPSAGSDENDLYVVYNYRENLWYHGSMERTAWDASRLRSNPIAADATSYIYYHEQGSNDGDTAMPAYIESGDMDIGEGDSFWFIDRFVPDLKLDAGTVDVEIRGSDWPMTTPSLRQSFTMNQTQSRPRVRARQVRIKFSSSDQSAKWRLGKVRIGARQDGRKS